MAKTILQRWHDSFTGGADVDGSSTSKSSGSSPGLALQNDFNKNNFADNIGTSVRPINSVSPIDAGRTFSILASLLAATENNQLLDKTDDFLLNQSVAADPERPQLVGSQDRNAVNQAKASRVLTKITGQGNTLVQSRPNVFKKLTEETTEDIMGGKGGQEVMGTQTIPATFSTTEQFQQKEVHQRYRIGPQADALDNWTSFTNSAGVDKNVAGETLETSNTFEVNANLTPTD